EPVAGRRPVRNDEVRFALRAGRLHTLSGDERDHPFPRGFQATHSGGGRMSELLDRPVTVRRLGLGDPGDAELLRHVPIEAPVAIEYNGIGYAVMMATPA